MTDSRVVTLPDLGEGLTESDLVEWLVSVGDTVTLNQVVAEVETAKALVQLPCPCAGVVERLHATPGETVPVGGPLLTVAVASPTAPTVATDASPPAPPVPPEAVDVVPVPPEVADAVPVPPEVADVVPEPPEVVDVVPDTAARTSVLVGYGPPVEGADRPHRRPRSARWVATHTAVEEPAAQQGTAGHGTAQHGTDGVRDAGSDVRAPAPRPSPPVRKLAHDLGVDLDHVHGTGSAGRVTRDDVLHALSRPGTARPGTARPETRRPETPRPETPRPRTPRPATTGETRVPVTGVRRRTAAAMVASAFSAPHASVHLTLDVTGTTDLLTWLRGDPALAGRHLTVLTIVAKAVTVALGRHPTLNARWDDAGEIVRYAHVGLGVAAATPRGLLVPVVHDADLLRLPDLADALRSLTEAARAGTTTPADLTGGTVTISNIGVFGVDGGVPILVPGQAAILATGRLRRQPWEHDGQVALRDVLTLTMSFDHRVVDGAEAAQFLTDVGAVLARPGTTLAMV